MAGGGAMASFAAAAAASSSWESSLFDSLALPGVGDDRGLFFRPLCRGAGWFFTACNCGVTSPTGAQRGTAKDWGPSPPKRFEALTHFLALKGMPALTKSTTGVCGWSVGEYKDWSRAETRPSLRGVASTCLRRRLEPAIVYRCGGGGVRRAARAEAVLLCSATSGAHTFTTLCHRCCGYENRSETSFCVPRQALSLSLRCFFAHHSARETRTRAESSQNTSIGP